MKYKTNKRENLQSQNQFFVKVNGIGKPLTRQTKKKGKAQTSNSRNKRTSQQTQQTLEAQWGM